MNALTEIKNYLSSRITIVSWTLSQPDLTNAMDANQLAEFKGRLKELQRTMEHLKVLHDD